MVENKTKNDFKCDNRNAETNNKEYDRYEKVSKIEGAPVWNEDLQKIVVGYH